MWKASVLVEQVLALQEGYAVGCMAKELFIIFWQRKIFSHCQSI